MVNIVAGNAIQVAATILVVSFIFPSRAVGARGVRALMAPKKRISVEWKIFARRRHHGRRCPGDFGPSRWQLSEKSTPIAGVFGRGVGGRFWR
jgi:hypothetical protein